MLGLHRYNDTFRRRLGMSGKLALVVSATIGSFALVSERVLFQARDDPR